MRTVAMADVLAEIVRNLRADLTFSDFPLIACGVMSTMHFKPGSNPDWRRHLQLVLDGIRARPE